MIDMRNTGVIRKIVRIWNENSRSYIDMFDGTDGWSKGLVIIVQNGRECSPEDGEHFLPGIFTKDIMEVLDRGNELASSPDNKNKREYHRDYKFHYYPDGYYKEDHPVLFIGKFRLDLGWHEYFVYQDTPDPDDGDMVYPADFMAKCRIYLTNGSGIKGATIISNSRRTFSYGEGIADESYIEMEGGGGLNTGIMYVHPMVFVHMYLKIKKGGRQWDYQMVVQQDQHLGYHMFKDTECGGYWLEVGLVLEGYDGIWPMFQIHFNEIMLEGRYVEEFKFDEEPI